MCGIIWGKRANNKPVKEFILEAYATQKARGSEGFGFVAIDGGKAFVFRSETEDGIKKMLARCKAPDILFHHRKPTSTDNLDFATHPILVSNPGVLTHDYLVVHNGVVTNPGIAKERHEKRGFVYTTEHDIVRTVTRGGKEIEVGRTTQFNDTEALAIEFALFMDGVTSEMMFSGTASIVAVQLRQGTNEVIAVHWGHNTGNPLCIENKGVKKGNVRFIKSVGGTDIDTGRLFTEDYATGQITERVVDFGYQYRTYAANYTFRNDAHNPVDQVRMGFHRDRNTRPDMEDFMGETYADYQEWLEEKANKHTMKDKRVIMLPQPEDFEDNSEVMASLSPTILTEYKNLLDDIEDAEADLDGWTEMLEQAVSKVEYDAYMQEVRECNQKLDKLQADLEVYQDIYGIPSPYYTRTIT